MASALHTRLFALALASCLLGGPAPARGGGCFEKALPVSKVEEYEALFRKLEADGGKLEAPLVFQKPEDQLAFLEALGRHHRIDWLNPEFIATLSERLPKALLKTGGDYIQAQKLLEAAFLASRNLAAGKSSFLGRWFKNSFKVDRLSVLEEKLLEEAVFRVRDLPSLLDFLSSSGIVRRPGLSAALRDYAKEFEVKVNAAVAAGSLGVSLYIQKFGARVPLSLETPNFRPSQAWLADLPRYEIERVMEAGPGSALYESFRKRLHGHAILDKAYLEYRRLIYLYLSYAAIAFVYEHREDILWVAKNPGESAKTVADFFSNTLPGALRTLWSVKDLRDTRKMQEHEDESYDPIAIVDERIESWERPFPRYNDGRKPTAEEIRRQREFYEEMEERGLFMIRVEYGPEERFERWKASYRRRNGRPPSPEEARDKLERYRKGEEKRKKLKRPPS